MVGTGELSPSKFKCETLQISKDFIKFSECQVTLRKYKPPIQDFLATVLVLKLHIFGKRVATWFSCCALKSLRHHTYYIGEVYLFFLNTDKKKQV